MASFFTDMSLISIIVPVYNVEKDLERCINSILAQTYENFELIIVNDGSTDSSGNICRSFTDKRIRYYEKANGGLASARNYGLQRATGDYLYCVDSDDYIDSDCLEYCLKKARETDADIVLCGYLMENGNKKQTINATAGVYEGEEINSRLAELKAKNIIDPAWNKLYRMDFVKNSGIVFPEGEIYEDTDFNLRLLKHKPRIVLSERCFYHYILHMGSITRRFNPEKLSTIKRRAILLKEVSSGIDEYCDYYYIKSVLSSIMDMFLSCEKQDILAAIKKEVQDPYFLSAAKNAAANGRNAVLITRAVKSGNAKRIYLFCKLAFVLKFRMQKLFLKVRQ